MALFAGYQHPLWPCMVETAGKKPRPAGRPCSKPRGGSVTAPQARLSRVGGQGAEGKQGPYAGSSLPSA